MSISKGRESQDGGNLAIVDLAGQGKDLERTYMATCELFSGKTQAGVESPFRALGISAEEQNALKRRGQRWIESAECKCEIACFARGNLGDGFKKVVCVATRAEKRGYPVLPLRGVP